MDNYDKVIYDTILGLYLLTSLGSNLKLLDNFIEKYDGPFKGWSAYVRI